MYKTAVSAFWTVEEIDLSKDRDDFDALSPQERHFVKHVLAFFAGADGIVNENLAARFMRDITIPEARSFYGFQIAMENVHQEMYGLMIDTLVSDAREKARLFDALSTVDVIRSKGEWALRWIEDDATSHASRLVAFACIEGIFFSGSFCSIYWLKERNLMPGLTASNEFISRDEALHTKFAVLMYTKHLSPAERLGVDEVRRIVSGAVDLEVEFICNALPCRLIGMNAELMMAYVRFVADRLLLQLGYTEMYGAENPFPFMERIALDNKTNFFEHRETSYAKANVGGEQHDTMNHVFDTDSTF
jgi:ribonucleoside-diphosphate reductase subunit M2